MEKKKTITAQDVKDVCAFIAGKTDSIFAPKAPQGENVTPYFDTDGTFQGVRVCALGEDFVIDAKDFQDGKEMPWREAMDALKAAGKTTWNLPQLYLTMFFRKQVDAILKKNGGDPLDNWYWTFAEFSAGSAFYYYGANGTVHISSKNVTFSSRGLLALS